MAFIKLVSKSVKTFKSLLFPLLDLAFGTHHFNVLIDGQIRAQRPLPYVAPTQMAYECPAFLCQALDVSPGGKLNQ